MLIKVVILMPIMCFFLYLRHGILIYYLKLVTIMLKNCKLFISEYYVFGYDENREFSLGAVTSFGDAIDICNTCSDFVTFNLYGKLSKSGSLLYIGCFSVEYGLI